MMEQELAGPVTKYWLKYYARNGLCELCGGSGIVDTTGVKTAAGVLVGGKNFCICPNGQTLRGPHRPE